MPQTESGSQSRTGIDVLESAKDARGNVTDVVRALERYNGSRSVVIIEIEFVRAGGATFPAARCIGVVFARFGKFPIGVTSVRFISGTTTWSQHAYGNAVDFMTSGARHRELAYFLNANRGSLNIAHLLADPYFPSPLGNHYNHVHVDFYPQWGGTPPGHPI